MNPSDTPRTDAVEIVGRMFSHVFEKEWVESDFARQLERELNEANEGLANAGLHVMEDALALKLLGEDRDAWRKCAEELARTSTSLQEGIALYMNGTAESVELISLAKEHDVALHHFNQLSKQKEGK